MHITCDFKHWRKAAKNTTLGPAFDTKKTNLGPVCNSTKTKSTEALFQQIGCCGCGSGEHRKGNKSKDWGSAMTGHLGNAGLEMFRGGAPGTLERSVNGSPDGCEQTPADLNELPESDH